MIKNWKNLLGMDNKFLPMTSLSDSDPFPLRQDEIPRQEKKGDRNPSRWLNIGDSVEYSEDNNELFKGVLLTIGGHPDGPGSTAKDRVNRKVQEYQEAPSEIRSAGRHDETDQGNHTS